MLNTIVLSQRLFTSAVLSVVLLSAATVSNAETAEVKIARAISAAPSDITNEATIMDVDGTILRAGTNRWVCIPGVGLIPGDEHPMCNDPVWMKWMAAMASGSAFTTDVIGVAYMMAGDPLLNVDNPMASDPNDGGVWGQEGAYVMLLSPDMGVLADLPRNPFIGGPYVMWEGTPMEHGRLYDARGTAATRLLHAGLSLNQIAGVMGWGLRYAANMIEKYAKISGDESDAILDLLEEAKHTPDVEL